MPKDLHDLPKFRDGLSYCYIEHCKIEQDGKSISLIDQEGTTPIPCATLALLMLGPGPSITHEAVKTLADNGCLVIWCGEEGVRFYAQGMGESRHSRKTTIQAELSSDPEKRLDVVRRMYVMRFKTEIRDDVTIQQLRGMEGVRIRDAYANASKIFNVAWHGRSYKRDSWSEADTVNKALSCANSCLYGICHSAIISGGYSPALGFIHMGKQLSFVYDVADLYKADISIPVAFEIGSREGAKNLERDVRYRMRDLFRETRLLQRIIPDIDYALGITETKPDVLDFDYDSDDALPGPLWGGQDIEAEGGRNAGDDT